MDQLHAVEQLQFAQVEIDTRTYGAKHRLRNSSTAMNVEANRHQVIDHRLDLLLRRLRLHCNNHYWFSVVSSQTRAGT